MNNFLIFYALLFFSPFGLAQVDVLVGKGRLEIVDSDWPLSHKSKRDIEARLMILPELSELVGKKQLYQISLPEDYLQPLQDNIENQLPTIEQKIQIQVLAAVKDQNLSPADEKLEGEGFVIEGDDGSRRVVMGSNEVVHDGEKLQELVVVGGKVDIRGQVASLVIIGGFVELLPGARITKELVIIGGHLEEHEGVEISGKRVDMSLPGGEEAWTILGDKAKGFLFKGMKDHSWIRYFGLFLKLGVLMLFLWLGDFLAPSYQREVEKYLKRNPGWSAFWGYFSVLMVLPITLFLTLSLIGIPLLPLQFSLLFVFAIYGEIHIAKYLVSLVPFFKERLRLATLVGLVVLEVAGLVSGFQILKWAIILVGFGAASKVFYGRILRPS